MQRDDLQAALEFMRDKGWLTPADTALYSLSDPDDGINANNAEDWAFKYRVRTAEKASLLNGGIVLKTLRDRSDEGSRVNHLAFTAYDVGTPESELNCMEVQGMGIIDSDGLEQPLKVAWGTTCRLDIVNTMCGPNEYGDGPGEDWDGVHTFPSLTKQQVGVVQDEDSFMYVMQLSQVMATCLTGVVDGTKVFIPYRPLGFHG